MLPFLTKTDTFLDLFKRWSHKIEKFDDPDHFEEIANWLNRVVQRGEIEAIHAIDFEQVSEKNKHKAFPNWILTYAFLAIEHYGRTLFENDLMDATQDELLDTINGAIFRLIKRPDDIVFHDWVDTWCDTMDEHFRQLDLASKNDDLFYELSLSFQAVFTCLKHFYAQEHHSLLYLNKQTLPEQIRTTCDDFLQANQVRLEILGRDITAPPAPTDAHHSLETLLDREAIAILKDERYSIEDNVDLLKQVLNTELLSFEHLSVEFEQYKQERETLRFQLMSLEQFKQDFQDLKETGAVGVDFKNFCNAHPQTMAWVYEANPPTEVENWLEQKPLPLPPLIESFWHHQNEPLEAFIEKALTHYQLECEKNESDIKEKILNNTPNESPRTRALLFDDFKKNHSESSPCLLQITLERDQSMIKLIETFQSFSRLSGLRNTQINRLDSFDQEANEFLREYDTRWTAFLNFLSCIFTGSKSNTRKQVDEIRALQPQMLTLKENYKHAIDENIETLQSEANVSEAIKTPLIDALASQNQQRANEARRDLPRRENNPNAFFNRLTQSARQFPGPQADSLPNLEPV